MKKEGKVDLLFVLISAIIVFGVYSMLVSGTVPQEFPANNTNASARFGFSWNNSIPAMTRFNATNPQFKCNVSSWNASNLTIVVANVKLFINRSNNIDMLVNTTSVLNATQQLNNTVAANTQEIVIFNVSTAFDEGTYAWMCQQEDNASTKVINQSGTSFFIIDTSPPAIAKINVSSNTTVFNTTSSSTKLSTGDFVRIAANFTDQFTTIHTVRLFVNYSGVANNEVNITGGTSGVEADNATIVNLTTVIPGNSSIVMGTVLNFTLQVNDSVGNVNITQALIFTVEGDGTPPGPINLTYPINLFNQSSATAPTFNFTAFDNNDTSFNCNISLTVGGSFFTNISNIEVTSGVAQKNTTTVPLINGTYTWNVTCIDGPGNFNTSLVSTFTVDNIPPKFDYYNFTDERLNNTVNPVNNTQLGAGAGNSTAQGRKIYATANFTDNLTSVFQGALQFFNITSPSWQTINSSPVGFEAFNDTANWINFTYQIPAGHNEFEGRNVSFRLIANDTLGNVNTTNVKNFTIMINDTFAPTITINGTLGVNNSNLTTTTVSVVSWAVVEGNALLEINVSIDGAVNNDDGCNKFKRFTTASGPNNVESNRNGSFATSSDSACTLGNGTHSMVVKSRDTWGNVETVFHNFTLSAGTIPVLSLNLTNLGRTAQHSKNATGAAGNTSNITSFVGIQLFALSTGLASIANITYVSSCNSSSTVVVSNYTTVYPFNESGCNTASANRTLTITTTDTAGNSATNTTTFLVDNVGPTLTVHSPTEGQTFRGVQTVLNISVFDADQALSFFGYYLDGDAVANLFTLNISAALGDVAGGINLTSTNLTNFTDGTHTIKFSVNDTLGNVRNSSAITFTQIARPIDMLTINQSIKDRNLNTSNVSFLDANGNLLTTAVDINQTLQLYMALNESGGYFTHFNVTINFNGSAANWNATDQIFFKINDTPIINHLKNNQTAKVNRSLSINESFARFLPNNNSYFGKVRLDSINVTNLTLGGRNELWYFSDENDLSNKVNITECSIGFQPAQDTALSATFPCWNNTNNMSVDIYVPHFSVIVLAENSEAPTVNVTTPEYPNQTVSMFVPNITVSADASLCEYSINGTVTKYVMTKSGNVCLGQLERFKNLNNARYNFTFNVTDTGGNVNTYILNFSVTDNTPSNSGSITSSPSTTSATVTATSVNESVNATVIYGTVNTSLTSIAMETDFNSTQTVSLSGLTASTTYYYNITVCDFNGNCKGNGTFSFSTSAAASSTTTTTTSSSSSAGSGAGAAVSNEAASTSKKWDSIAAGTSAILTINNADIAVTGVIIDAANSVANAEVKVASLTANPYTTAAATKVYQYLQLTKQNIADSDASGIKVNFKVSKTWLATNAVAEANVALYRYSNGAWNALPTTMTGSDANNVLYQATTPGFSTFAIGVKEEGVVPPAGVEICTDLTDNDADGLVDSADPDCAAPPAPVPEICDDTIDNDWDGAIDSADSDCQVAPPAPVEEKKGLSSTAIAWILVAIIVVIAIIGFVMMKKKMQQQ